MERPIPKHEIVIQNTYQEDSPAHDPHNVTITMYSDDAKRWIEQEAPAFGKLGELTMHRLIGVLGKMMDSRGDSSSKELFDLLTPPPGVSKLELHIEKCYDAPDVTRYLVEGYREMNRQPHDGSPSQE